MCRSDNILSKDSSVSLQRDACDRDDTHSHTLSHSHPTRHRRCNHSQYILARTGAVLLARDKYYIFFLYFPLKSYFISTIANARVVIKAPRGNFISIALKYFITLFDSFQIHIERTFRVSVNVELILSSIREESVRVSYVSRVVAHLANMLEKPFQLAPYLPVIRSHFAV